MVDIKETVPVSHVDTKKTTNTTVTEESVVSDDLISPDAKSVSQKLSLIFAGIALGSDGYQTMIIGNFCIYADPFQT